MTSEYDFDERGGVRIAHHRDDPKKDVQIDASWVTPEDDEIFAPWEDLVAAILSEDITGYIDVSSRDSVGTVDIDQACANLVDAAHIDMVENDRHARALIECLIEEDIVEETDGEIVLFRNVSATEMENPNFLYNWAAAMEMVRGKIEQQIDRAEKLEERMNQKLEDIQGIGDDIIQRSPQEQIDRVDQRLRALGEDNDKVPRNPEELPSEEYREFQQLQKTYRIARSRFKIRDNATIETTGEVDVDPEVLMQGQIDNFQQLQQAFVEYERTLRMAIEYNEWNDHGISELLDGLVEMLSGIAQIDQSLEDESPEEMDETLQELRSDAQTAYEGKQELEETNEDPENKAEEVEEAMDRPEFESTFE